MPQSSRPRRGAQAFLSDSSGQVTLLFALMVIPLLCTIGAALDYSRTRSAKVRLDSALDAAVLSVASRKTNVFNETEIRTKLQEQFRAQVSTIKAIKILDGNGFTVSVTTNDKEVTIKASYNVHVETTLSKLMRFDNMHVSGTATATRNFTPYMDFYLLLDNSPSMGLAATDAAIVKLAGLTGGCAFACHEYNWGSGTLPLGDKTTSNYYIARRNNVPLRIDNVVKAAQDLTDYATADARLPNQYRMALYSFSDIFTKHSSLTASLSTVKASAGNITLAYSYRNNPDNQTSYIRTMPKISSEIPNSGSGLNANDPIRFLFFVTDGVQDAPLDGKTMTSFDKKVGADRFLGVIDPVLCRGMKERGIRIGIIYTTYLPLDQGIYWNDYYVAHIAPFKTKIPANLEACATPGLFFPVTTGGDITKAMQDLFKASVTSVRLTN